jgi:hypothetical protein
MLNENCYNIFFFPVYLLGTYHTSNSELGLFCSILLYVCQKSKGHISYALLSHVYKQKRPDIGEELNTKENIISLDILENSFHFLLTTFFSGKLFDSEMLRA